jgi:hypothetical protein
VGSGLTSSTSSGFVSILNSFFFSACETARGACSCSVCFLICLLLNNIPATTIAAIKTVPAILKNAFLFIAAFSSVIFSLSLARSSFSFSIKSLS